MEKKYKQIKYKFILLFIFLLTFSNFVLFVSLLQGFSLDISTFINIALKQQGGLKILDDFFVPEGFLIPILYYYLAIFIENKTVAHFFISILLNSFYFLLIFLIISNKFKDNLTALYFAFISSCFFLSLMGGIYFEHFIIVFFLTGILLVDISNKSILNLLLLSLILNFLFFAKISIGIPAILLIFIYFIFVNKKNFKSYYYLFIFSLIIFLFFLYFIFSNNWSEYYKQVFEVGMIYSKYYKNSNLITIFTNPFDLDLKLLLFNFKEILSGNLNLNYGAILSSLYSFLMILLLVILIFKKNKNYFLIFLILSHFALFSISGQGFANKYFLTGIISGALYSSNYNISLKYFKILLLNLVFLLLLINNKFINVDSINTLSNFELYDKKTFNDNIDRYQSNLDLIKYFNEINSIINNQSYFILNKQLFYINLHRNTHSVDPLSMYDHVNCNKYSQSCVNLVLKQFEIKKPNYIIYVERENKWFIDGYLFDLHSTISTRYNAEKFKFNTITMLKINY